MAEALDDAALFDRVQAHTIRWFWERGDPLSGMAPDRDASEPGVVTTGGSGFAMMALIAGIERGLLSREDVRDRIALMVTTLERVDRFHGAWSHWLDARSGRAVPFGELDDGGDLVETAFVVQGLLTARSYFDRPEEADLRGRLDALWRGVEWDFYKAPDDAVLLWHWSPNHGFAMNHAIRGWNECLIVYVLAAASPTHPIEPALYHRGWTDSPDFRNGRTELGVELPLGPPLGGPLFFAHYSFLGLDPRGLVDRYADYWLQNQRHVALNRAWCLANPNQCAGYGPDCWGLTASDHEGGYSAHAPGAETDLCVIAPTAAIASFPYAPDWAMQAMRAFHDRLGERIWTDWGFTDAFCESGGWYSDTHLAIDQGPIAIMMENHRSGLLWDLFMRAPEIATGLARLGFSRVPLMA